MKILKYTFLMISAGMLLSANNGCNETKEAVVSGVNYNKDVEIEEGKSLLYRIEGKNLEKPSYLFGTIHMIAKKDYEMGERLEDIAANVDVLVMELDLDDMMGEIFSIMQGATLPQGTTLEDYMSPGAFDTLKSYMLDTMSISMMEFTMYKKMKPIFLSQLFMQQMMGDEMVAFEMEFKAIADTHGIDMVGLETFEQQIGLFDSIPIEQQVDMLLESMRDQGGGVQDIDKLVQFYKEQQIDSLFALMNRDYEDFMQFNDALLVQRNLAWIPLIEELIQERQALIAVGAGHLPGENGVISLLRAEGYKLIPVSTKESRK